MTFYVVAKYKTDDKGKEISGTSEILTEPESFLDAKEIMRDLRKEARNKGEKNVKFTTIKTSY